ncbi:MAG: DUF2007 domain-containing protein [Clostridia bacterium]|nr:DUF2007 domain-containing protein [Clostridia bacterium]
MVVCPDCKTEYDGNKKSCPVCKPENRTKDKPAEEWKYLTTVKNNIEFEIIKDVLEMGNIPVVQKVKGMDGYLQIIMGVPLAGIEVFVPEDRFEEAVQLLDAKSADELTGDVD